MTINPRTVGSSHVRTVAFGLSVGALVVLAQAVQMGRGTAFVLGGVGLLAAVASARLWRQKLAVTSNGMIDRRLIRDRRISWLEVADFYIGRPRIAGGLCIWLVDVHGSEYPLRSTWTTDRKRDIATTEKVVKELRQHVAEARAEGIAAMPNAKHELPAGPSRPLLPTIPIAKLNTGCVTTAVVNGKAVNGGHINNPRSTTVEIVRTVASRDTRAPVKNGARRR